MVTPLIPVGVMFCYLLDCWIYFLFVHLYSRCHPVGFSVPCSIAAGFLLDHYTYTRACEAGGNSTYFCRCHLVLFARLLDLFFICTAL